MALLQDDRALQNFRDYLKIQSNHPNPDYDGCVTFLQGLATEIGLTSKVIQLTDKNPALIFTWQGENLDLPSILLNSHMDVVPVIKEDWRFDPFGGHIDEKGNIYGRGAQDMKCATIAQLEAIRRLKNAGVKLKRTVHLTILPDEEIGSANGMEKFVETESFKNLNIGFDLDEGGVHPHNNSGLIFMNERCRWAINIHCPYNGSNQENKTCGEHVRKVLDNFMDFREQEYKKFHNHGHNLADVTTINLNTLKGEIKNSIPSEIVLGFDIRLAVGTNQDQFEEWINDVCLKAGEGVYVEYIIRESSVKTTCDESNPFIIALDNALTDLGLECVKNNCYGATDARFVRKVGIPAVGFLAFFNTETLIHATNEYINSQEFLRGISNYEKIISALANC